MLYSKTLKLQAEMEAFKKFNDTCNINFILFDLNKFFDGISYLGDLMRMKLNVVSVNRKLISNNIVIPTKFKGPNYVKILILISTIKKIIKNITHYYSAQRNIDK